LSLGRSEASKVEVAGRIGTDPASTSATVSLTVAGGNGRGSLFAYPAGSERPKVATLTYGKSATTVQTPVPIGRGGSIVIENDGSNGRTVNVDVAGAHEPASLPGGRSFALRKTPKTVVDTSAGKGFSNLGAGVTKTIGLGDSVPRSADSVMLQVTAKKANSAGALTFWQTGTGKPSTVDLSVPAEDMVSGTVVVSVGDGRKVQVKNSGAAGLDVKVTVLGSFH
jgi:hypothetical protein